MKNQITNEKSKKKLTTRRKVISAPDLPIVTERVKKAGMYLVPPEEIRKYKQEVVMKSAESKMKRPKPKQNISTKKLTDAAVDKILMEPLRPTSEEKKIAEDYQWLIKRNIMKLMSAAKKRANQEGPARKKPTNKAKTSGGTVILQKTKSEITRENQEGVLIQLEKPKIQKRPRKTKSATKGDVKREVVVNRRVETANSTKRNEKTIPKEKPEAPGAIGQFIMDNPPMTVQPKSPKVNNPQHSPAPNSNVKALKKLFNVFKAPPENLTKTKDSKEINIIKEKRQKSDGKIGANTLQVEEKEAELKGKKKKFLKKKIPEKIMKVVKPEGLIKDEHQAKNRKKVRSEISAPENKILQMLEVPSASSKIEKKKRKQANEKLLQAFSTR